MEKLQFVKTVMPKLLLSMAFLLILPSLSCSTQADHCTRQNDCLNEGTCVNGTGGYSCACAQGFTGNHCEINKDDCAGHTYCLNGGTCVDGASSYTCACAEAFFGNYCEHLNECVYPGTCVSLNALSSDAKCKCREGYAPDPHDGRRCELVDKNLNKNATLIYGTFIGGIDQFSLSQQTVTRIQDHSSVSVALDVMYRTNTMFWSDKSGKIYTAPIRQGAAKTVVLIDSRSDIRSVAVDWVYGHLYFADRESKTMSVANLDGSMKKVLFDTQVTRTPAIVLDPLSGWMYFVVDEDAQIIERAALDGSGREVLASLKPRSPHGLALDMTQNRLYWTADEDNNSASIRSMNVDGSDQKLVFRATRYRAFHSISTFGDFVYWRDWYTKAVYRTNKCGSKRATKILSTDSQFDSWNTLQAYHVSKQPEGVNYCENWIGEQCSHLCFRIPSTKNETVATRCACPDGLTLSSDQLTCT